MKKIKIHFVLIKRRILTWNYISKRKLKIKYKQTHHRVSKFIKTKIFYNLSLLYIKGNSIASKYLKEVLIAICFTTLINFYVYFAITDIFNIEVIPPDKLSNFLLVIGSMIGGIIAIVFTLSIFALQKAGELFSPWFIGKYIHDYQERKSYFLIILIDFLFFAISIGILSSQSLIQNKALLTYESLLLIIILFLLIYDHYEKVRKKIDPINGLNKLLRDANDILKNIRPLARKMYKIIKYKKPQESKEKILIKLIDEREPEINYIIQNITDICLRLSDRRQIEAAKIGVSHINIIIHNYLCTKNKFFLLAGSPKYFGAVECDGSKFIGQNVETLKNIGKQFISEGKINNARHILKILENIAISSTKIEFSEKTYPEENPIFSLIIEYIYEYLEYAVEKKETEIVYPGVQSLSKLGQIAATKNLTSAIDSVQDKLFSIGQNYMIGKYGFICESCQEGLMIIINTLIEKQSVNRYIYEKSLKYIQDFAHIYSEGIKNKLITNSIEVSQRLHCGMNLIKQTIDKLPYHYKSHKNYKNIYLLFLELIYETIRKSFEQKINYGASISLLLMSIQNTLEQLIENEDLTDKSQIIELIKKYIHLPAWSINNKIPDSFFMQINSITTIPINLLCREQNELLLPELLNALDHICKKIIKIKLISARNYLLIVVQLGIIAYKYQLSSLSRIIDKIKELENMYNDSQKEYYSKTGLPLQTQQEFIEKESLLTTVYAWKSNLINIRTNLRGSYDEIIVSMISTEDIDRFAAYLWHTYPSNSAIEEELKNIITESIKNEQNKNP